MMTLRQQATLPTPSALPAMSQAELTSAEEKAGATCEPSGPSAIRCTTTTQREELLARFDARGKLAAIDRVRYGLSPADATQAIHDKTFEATTRFGAAPTRTWGEANADYLARPLRQAGFEYRYVNVAIDVTVTHMGTGDGIVLREQQRSIPATGS